tara:strand:+ start:5496 stop:8132 length:2637 start_codon:yes stop_codon:yes gene_type:complete
MCSVLAHLTDAQRVLLQKMHEQPVNPLVATTEQNQKMRQVRHTARLLQQSTEKKNRTTTVPWSGVCSPLFKLKHAGYTTLRCVDILAETEPAESILAATLGETRCAAMAESGWHTAMGCAPARSCCLFVFVVEPTEHTHTTGLRVSLNTTALNAAAHFAGYNNTSSAAAARCIRVVACCGVAHLRAVAGAFGASDADVASAVQGIQETVSVVTLVGWCMPDARHTAVICTHADATVRSAHIFVEQLQKQLLRAKHDYAAPLAACLLKSMPVCPPDAFRTYDNLANLQFAAKLDALDYDEPAAAGSKDEALVFTGVLVRMHRPFRNTGAAEHGRMLNEAFVGVMLCKFQYLAEASELMASMCAEGGHGLLRSPRGLREEMLGLRVAGICCEWTLLGDEVSLYATGAHHVPGEMFNGERGTPIVVRCAAANVLNDPLCQRICMTPCHPFSCVPHAVSLHAYNDEYFDRVRNFGVCTMLGTQRSSAGEVAVQEFNRLAADDCDEGGYRDAIALCTPRSCASQLSRTSCSPEMQALSQFAVRHEDVSVRLFELFGLRHTRHAEHTLGDIVALEDHSAVPRTLRLFVAEAAQHTGLRASLADAFSVATDQLTRVRVKGSESCHHQEERARLKRVADAALDMTSSAATATATRTVQQRVTTASRPWVQSPRRRTDHLLSTLGLRRAPPTSRLRILCDTSVMAEMLVGLMHGRVMDHTDTDTETDSNPFGCSDALMEHACDALRLEKRFDSKTLSTKEQADAFMPALCRCLAVLLGSQESACVECPVQVLLLQEDPPFEDERAQCEDTWSRGLRDIGKFTAQGKLVETTEAQMRALVEAHSQKTETTGEVNGNGNGNGNGKPRLAVLIKTGVGMASVLCPTTAVD